MKEYNDLSNFFKEELLQHKVETNPYEQLLIEKMAKKNAFLSFNWLEFNVYYAAMIVSGFLITMGLAGHYVSQFMYPQTQVNLPKVEQSNQLHEKSKSSNLIIKQVESQPEKATNKPKALPNNKIQNTDKQEIKKENNELTNKTELISTPPIIEQQVKTTETQVLKADTIKPIRKTIFVTQKDTIYKIDSVKVKINKRK